MDLKIDGYELVEKIGQGGMGVVYRAIQLSLDREVAIKLLPRTLTLDEESVALFKREAKVIASLRHQNVVQIHEAGIVDGQHYFVMEYIRGYTVENWLTRKGRLAEEDALVVAQCVGQALEYAWNRAKIIHGDIKPDNVMVDDDGTIKLADFLALRAAHDGVASDLILGTPNYMPPEQVHGEGPMDFRADIYELGALLYHLVTGKVPFGHLDDYNEVMQSQVSNYILDPCEIEPSVSAPCAWLIEWFMAKKPEDRPNSWGQAVAGVLAVANGKMPNGTMPAVGLSTVKRSAARDQKWPDSSAEDEDLSPDEPIDLFATPSEDSTASRRPIILVGILAACFLLGAAYAFRAPILMALGLQQDDGIIPLEQLEPDGTFLYDHPPVSDPISDPDSRGVVPERRHVVRQPVAVPKKSVPVLSPIVPLIKPPVEQTIPVQAHPPASELKEYLQAVAAVGAKTRKRQYKTSLSMLDSWLARNEEHAYRNELIATRDHIAGLPAVWESLNANSAKFVGSKVTLRNGRTGTISAFADMKATLTVKSSSADALVEYMIQLSDITDKDIYKLLEKADPQSFSKHRIMLLIAGLRLAEAETLLQLSELGDSERTDLNAWLLSWQEAFANLRAAAALERLQKIVDLGYYEKADQMLQEIKLDFLDTDMLQWAEVDQLFLIEMAISDGVNASKAEKNKGTATGEDEKVSTVVAGGADPSGTPVVQPFDRVAAVHKDVKRVNQQTLPAGIEKVTVKELIQDMPAYDQRVIKLCFNMTTGQRNISEDIGEVRVGFGGFYTSALYDREGAGWISKRKNWKREYVYAVVHAEQRLVVMLGRSRKRLGGSLGSSFSW